MSLRALWIAIFHAVSEDPDLTAYAQADLSTLDAPEESWNIKSCVARY